MHRNRRRGRASTIVYSHRRRRIGRIGVSLNVRDTTAVLTRRLGVGLLVLILGLALRLGVRLGLASRSTSTSILVLIALVELARGIRTRTDVSLVDVCPSAAPLPVTA
jgi:hypothetical protein